MSEREARDFMSVDSFSQLPFMRREKPLNPPVRLFGFDFQPERSASPDTDRRRSSSATPADGGSAGESIRRFECNYCLRNFPTSQALGGHQNAHKRERQQAKRATLAAATAEGQLQGLLSYHGHRAPASPLLRYPSWSFSSGDGVRFYGRLDSVQQRFNGAPMPGKWSALQDAGTHRHHRLHFPAEAPPPSFALFSGDRERKESRYDDESKDGISLDLRL